MLNNFFNKIYYQEIDSTNTEGKRLIQNNKITNNTIILADKQTNGRGRLNRTWSSKEVNNLYCTFIMSTNNYSNHIINFLPFIMAVAVGESIDYYNNQATTLDLPHNPKISDELRTKAGSSTGMYLRLHEEQRDNFYAEGSERLSYTAGLSYKWPNDLLLNNKKFCGILIEKERDFALMGIGVNIISNPDNTRFPATNLRAEGIVTNKDSLINNIVNYLTDNFLIAEKYGITPIKNKWLNKAYNLNKVINMNTNDKDNIQGVFVDIKDNGSLVLKLSDHSMVEVNFGDVG